MESFISSLSGGDREENSNFGKSNLDAKMEQSEKLEAGVSLDDMNEAGSAFRDFVTTQVPKVAMNTLKAIKNGLTPGFVKRMTKRKIHAKKLEDLEGKLEDLNDNLQDTIEGELHHRDLVRKQDKIIRELIEAKRHIREEVKKVIEEAEADKIEQEFQNYHKRRDQQVAELKAIEEKERKEKIAKCQADQIQDRLWRIDYFGEQAKVYGEESKLSSEVEARRMRHQQSLDRIYVEWEDREDARMHMQVDVPPRSEPIGLEGKELGFYGMPMHHNPLTQYHSKPPEERIEQDMLLEEVDQHDVMLGESVGADRAYEDASIQQQEKENALRRQQDLYNSLQDSIKDAKQAVEKMHEMREVLEKDLGQVNEEILVIEKQQLGPPRRIPRAAEIPTMNEWKKRAAHISKKLQELDYSIEKANKQRSAAEAQAISLAKTLAVMKESLEVANSNLREVTPGNLELLPMVVGRSLHKIAGNTPAMNPKETLDAVTHQSRLVAAKDESKGVLQLHKEATKIDQNIWLKRQKENEKRADFERVISRLVNISERLQSAAVTTQRVNIIDSMRGFQLSGLKLKPIYTKVMGMLPWFKHFDSQVSFNIVQYVANSALGGISFEVSPDAESISAFANGVTLGEDPSMNGCCCGVIELPKSTLWSIVITVSKQGRGPEFDNPDDRDFVTVKMGPTLSSLSVLGTFFNRINPATGTVIYDTRYVFRGNTFAFRFDFSSNTTETKRHLAVSTGIYEEYENKDLEILKDPKGPAGRTRVLSSFVKMLRIDEKTGKLRETRLLEELIMAESSTAQYWDSDIVSQTMQRYSREYFLRILRAEVLLFQEIKKAEYLRREKEIAAMKGMVADVDVDQEARLEQSKQRYVKKKRVAQGRILDEGNDLVGKRIILWDSEANKWRNLSIMGCVVNWVDNGMKALITHRVQEYDDGYEFLGDEKEVNLASFKWFPAPIQVIDPQSIARWKEKKRWDETIKRIKDSANARCAKLKRRYDRYEKKQLKLFEQMKNKAMLSFEMNVDQKAREYISAPETQEAAKEEFKKVVLDVKKGLVKLDSSKRNRKEQAMNVAKDRLMDRFRTKERDTLVERIKSKEEEMFIDFEGRKEGLQETQDEIQAAAKAEAQSLVDLIQEQIRERKKGLLEQVKFPPEVFKRAAPSAQFCEHLKTKAWGNNYATGVKCCVCGKELSEIHNEESQILGYGSGCDPWMYDAVRRHRENEASFRFKESSELAVVEEERRRLEKERRIMDENEAYFYDFQDLKVVYEFDHRHAREIKAHGIFRQGLQWSEQELEMFEEKKMIQERVRLEQEGLPETLLEEYDPLAMVENPPPTFRAMDERRKAQYVELQFAIGRLHNFMKRINELKMNRFALLSDRDMYAAVLESLHKDSYKYEAQLDCIEKDLDRTSKLLATFAHMQALWAQANHILNQARKDKMRAEMAQCGVWDDVREVGDKATFLKQEMMALLKVKHLTDARLENQEKSVSFRQQFVDTAYTKFVEANKISAALLYCKPGNLVYTRYGQCYITSYRPSDDMVMLTLPFCNPPAKAWIHYKEIIDCEHSKQRAEVMLMDMEDAAMQRIHIEERSKIRKERFLMQKEEEGIRRYYEFMDLGKHEVVAMKKGIDEKVEEFFQITESQRYYQLQKKNVEALLSKMIKERKFQRKHYIGPKSGRPKAMSMWEIFSQRKAITSELKEKYILGAAQAVERKIKVDLHRQRFEWVQNYSFENFINQVVGELIADIAKESFNEGLVAKGFAERKSSIYMPQPPWMQYPTYNALATIWSSRKEELRIKIAMNKGITVKLQAKTEPKKKLHLLDPKEVARMKEERKRRKEEIARQEKMCKEMQAEEMRCRDFYRKELLENLRERRHMRDEDRRSLQMRKDEEKRRLEAESLYAVVGDKDSKGKKKDMSLERRRQELKEIAIERRRRAEDQAYMVIEDKLSQMLREMDLLERQRKAYIAEYGEDDDDGEVSPYDVVTEMDHKREMKVPEWMKKPLNFEKWDVLSRNKYIFLQIQIHKKTRAREKNIQREFRKLERMEKKSYKEWDMLHKVAEQTTNEAELALMEGEEDLRDAEAALQDLRENIMRLLIYCREKGEEEVKALTELKRRTQLATRRDRELKEADDWLSLCLRRAKNRDKLKRRVSSDCKWVDTDSINGFHQRFATERLRERLYAYYFKEIVSSIINRSEIIATERTLMGLQERLSFNKARLVDRTEGMRSLLGDIRREEYLRMRRSFLNQKFFAKSRQMTLKERFTSWVRFFFWNRGHKDAYDLKFELIKRQLEIDRQFKTQLLKKDHPLNQQHEGPRPELKTMMQKHRERTIQCKNCNKFYLESQNTSSSCEYHPKQYIMECPSSCPNPGLTVLCMSHRKRRWTCCDATRQDITGCSRRYHYPPDSDPVYDRIMDKINIRDAELLLDLDKKLDQARKADWAAKANEAKRAQVFKMEDTIKEARATAERITNIKFV